jgi:hypothetical protein
LTREIQCDARFSGFDVLKEAELAFIDPVCKISGVLEVSV